MAIDKLAASDDRTGAVPDLKELVLRVVHSGQRHGAIGLPPLIRPKDGVEPMLGWLMNLARDAGRHGEHFIIQEKFGFRAFAVISTCAAPLRRIRGTEQSGRSAPGGERQGERS